MYIIVAVQRHTGRHDACLELGKHLLTLNKKRNKRLNMHLLNKLFAKQLNLRRSPKGNGRVESLVLASQGSLHAQNMSS